MASVFNLIASIVILSQTYTAAQEFGKCRFSDGTLLPNTQQFGQYAPCAETGSLSAVCCALIRDNEPGGNLSMGATRDECLPNGICQNRWTQSEDGLQVTAWFITYCTENYTGGKCMNVCPQDSKITPCTGKGDSDRWCCGDSNSCCRSNIGVINLAQVLGAGISSTSFSSSSAGSQSSGTRTFETATESALISTLPTARTTPTESAHNDDPRDLARGIIAAVVIAAIAGVAGIVAGCWFIRRRLRKSRRLATREHGPVIMYKADTHQGLVIHEVGVAETKPELYSRSTPFELASEPCELDSSQSRAAK